MKTLKLILYAALALAALPLFSLADDSKGIYGRDDRLDFFEAPPEMRDLADSVVSLWDAADVSGGVFSSGVSLATAEFGSASGLCPSERFYTQPVSIGSLCSGSLVGEDLVMTAGHCMKTEDDCKKTKVVFGYAIKTAGAEAATTLPDSEVYDCAGIVRRFNSRDPGSGGPGDKFYGADFALIRLDRKVIGHKPLALNRGADLKKGDGVFTIGHPAGLPLKIAGGATVRDFTGAGYFKTDLDAFGGNSGSPVFNAATGLIEGIVVRGGQDFISTPAGCSVTATVAQAGGRGEQVTKISALSAFIPE